MHEESHIQAYMELNDIDRQEAIERLNVFSEATDDQQRANFLVDLFTHYKFDFDHFEKCFWRDNKTLAVSERPTWSYKQRSCIGMMSERYLKRMVDRSW